MKTGQTVKIEIKRPNRKSLIATGTLVGVVDSKFRGMKDYIIRDATIPEMRVRKETIIK